jgi:glycosyltransferase involved in cell wall biosynthesis
VKVVHLNTHTYGGAAIAARRIHDALLDLAVDSRLVTRYGTNDGTRRHFFLEDESIRKRIRKNPVLFRFAKFIQRNTVHPNLANRPDGFELFSPLVSKDASSLYPLLEDCELIHLHWVSDFIGYAPFFRRFCTKKFIWTLHDMNPFTGGCHHADGCQKFETVCRPCPQLLHTIDEHYAGTIQSEKTVALDQLAADQMIVVSPSAWLLELSKKSRVTSRFKHLLVHNPSFVSPLPLNRDATRRRLNLPLDKKIVLFVSDNLRNPRKGIDKIFEAYRQMENKEKVWLLGIGNSAGQRTDLPVAYTGPISEPTRLAEYFACADLFVMPSVAENSPLVVIEALTCGTPVVASGVGGIPELIGDDGGILVPPNDPLALAGALSEALFDRTFDREKIQEMTRKIHSPALVALRYQDVYRTLLGW